MQVIIRKVKNGKSLKVLSHEGRFYAIAPKKGAYEIELYNNCPRRREAVVSVDGLCIMNGEKASTEDRGYVLEPRQRLVIKGWRRDDSEVARFEFKPNEESYSEQMGHGKRNTGVIGVAVFEEKDVWGQTIHIIEKWYTRPTVWPQGTWCEHVSYNAGGQFEDYALVGRGMSFCSNSVGPVYGSASSVEDRLISGETVRTSGGLFQPETVRSGSSRKVVRRRVNAQPAKKSVDLGTGYGERATMQVSRTTFHRASTKPQCVITLQYGTKARLKERGIPVEMVNEQAAKPEPFPGNASCPAPAGWSVR